MEKLSGFGIIVKKPISVWSRNLNISPKSFITNLTKATINGFKGDIDDCAENLLDSIADIKTEEKIGQLAWILIYQAIQVSTADLIKECVDLLQITSKFRLDVTEQKLEKCLNDIFDTDLIITSDFLSNPEELNVVEAFSSLIELFCIEFEASSIDAKSIASKLPSKFTLSLYNIWLDSAEKFQPLLNVLDSPVSKKNNEYLKWKIYHQSLHASLDKRVFKESFGLKDIYIKPRAYYIAPKKIELGEIESSKKTPTKHVVNLHNHLQEFVLNNKTSDNLRLISGDPGSGKSSFSKCFASEMSKNTGYNVLLIQLHHLDMSKDLNSAIQGYCDDYKYLKGVDISATNQLVIIFDGLDEISMQGQVGETISRNFINNLKRKADISAQVNLDVKFIVTGRDLAIQSCENIVKESYKFLHILPYYISEYKPSFNLEDFDDPAKLLDIDQRKIWWKKFSDLKGIDEESIPESIDTFELAPINSQPLLGYLLALSFLRGKVNFNENPNLNTIYQDLLESIFDRQYASENGDCNKTHSSIERLSKADFDTLMQEVALAVWHCKGVTATENYIYNHLKENELENLLENFTSDVENGVSNLLLSFYFRKHGQTEQGESTFEFTHKSFGEYLTSKKLVNLMLDLSESFAEKKLNHRKGKKLEEIISEFIIAAGRAPFEVYFYKFVRDEFENINLDNEKLMQVLELIEQIIIYSIQNNFALHKLSHLTFKEMIDYSDNVNLALLALHSACNKQIYCTNQKNYSSSNFQLKTKNIDKWLYSNSLNRQFIQYLEYLDLSSVSLQACDFIGSNLSFSKLHASEFFHCSFMEAVFDDADMTSSVLFDCNFDSACFDATDLHASRIEGCKFSSTYMHGAIMTDVVCTKCDFVQAYMEDVKFCRSVFSDSDFSQVEFSDSELINVGFRNCNLSNSEFRDASLQGCRFNESNLAHVNFENADLTNVVFINCNLSFVKLVGANLKGCNLSQANLAGVDFKGVNLTGCILPSELAKTLLVQELVVENNS